MVESARSTASKAIGIFTYVDQDDEESGRQALRLICSVTTGPRLVHSEYWNHLAEVAIKWADRQNVSPLILMMCGDDVIFRTQGWDRIVEDAFAASPDKILMVHGDDLSPNGKNFATLPFVCRRWVEVAGRMTIPWSSGDYADTWINDIANSLGRRQFVPIVTEHMHPAWGKAPMDLTYQETTERKHRDHTAKLYWAHEHDRIEDTDKLRAAMTVSVANHA